MSTGLEALYTAFAEAQATMNNVGKDKKGNFGQYASLDSVVSAVREAFAPHKLGFTQSCGATNGWLEVKTTIFHASGQSLEFITNVPLTDKLTPQGMGSAITYARRYGLMAAAGLAPTDDDDGQKATDESNRSVSTSTKATGLTLTKEQTLAELNQKQPPLAPERRALLQARLKELQTS